MKQKNNGLILKDLCARLLYGVKVLVDDKQWCDFNKDIPVELTLDNSYRILLGVTLGYVKPYLFPLSNMTEEQKYDFYCRFIENDCDFDDFKEFYLDNGMWHKLLTSLDDIEAIIDWFHKNHFDYRGLIPMGLANDATNKNIY